ncbi:hypothetical protein B1810_02355 [Panacagrimonas perspica]|nr:hypothetical protein B1810_02355 [Panacagrimonas perspica]
MQPIRSGGCFPSFQRAPAVRQRRLSVFEEEETRDSAAPILFPLMGDKIGVALRRRATHVGRTPVGECDVSRSAGIQAVTAFA